MVMGYFVFFAEVNCPPIIICQLAKVLMKKAAAAPVLFVWFMYK